MILIDILVHECKTLPRSEYSMKAGRYILALTTWPYLCEQFFFSHEKHVLIIITRTITIFSILRRKQNMSKHYKCNKSELVC